MELEKLSSTLESILFASDRPVTIDRMIGVFPEEEAPKESKIKEALEMVKERYLSSAHGFELREAQGGFHFVTKAENAEIVRRFLETKPFRLGRSALEVMAIVAYRGPLTRAEIDHVRGIDSSHLLRTLIERGLVKMAGKAEIPGRPVQYTPTPKFLEVIGLKDLSELPPLSELDQLQGQTEDPIKSLEMGLDKFIEEETAAEPDHADDAGLEAISTLIDSARQGSKEVYASPVEAQVAETNEEAAKSMQSHAKMRKKKQTITFDELTTSETLAIEQAVSGEGEQIAIESELIEAPVTVPLPDSDLVN